MRLKPLSLLLAAASVLMIGCNHGPTGKLAGTWSGALPNGVPAEMTFTADGSLKIQADNPASQTMKIDILGKYHDEGDQLYMTMEDVQFENVPPEIKAQEGKLKEDMKKTLEIGTEKVTSLTWDGDKSFTTKNADGKTSTFKKKG